MLRGSSFPSYDREYSVTNHLKVSYFPKDHSAVTTDQGQVISKWAYGPLVKHTLSQCPFYTDAVIKYYKLDIDITGSEGLLCSGSQRSFTSNSSIPGSNYNWVKDNNLSTVSGGDSDILVQGAGSGDAYIYLQMTTPSGEVATSSTKEFWVGTPQITNKKVDGSNYYAGFQICPGDHYLSVTPVGDGAGTATWTVPAGIMYFVGTNTLDFEFPFDASSVAITTRSANTCGTGTNGSFYLTKKYWGCSGYYGMTLSPNPTSDNVTITMLDNQPLIDYAESGNTPVDITDSKADEPTSYTISIYNNQSTLLSSATRSGKSFNIPLTNMLNGTYTIEVSDGRNSYRQQLIVKRN